MKLKTLEISGFKSFANRTKIDFMPGITGSSVPMGLENRILLKRFAG